MHPPPLHALPKLSRRAFLAAAATAGAGAGASGLYLARDTAVEVVRTVTPQLVPGVAAAPWLRVALLTDLHAPHDYVDMPALARSIRGFDPHLLLIVGDSIDRTGETSQLRAFGALSARHGTFATLGNHEYWSGCDLAELRREYADAGVRLLVNEDLTVEVEGRAVRVAGLDDARAGRPHYSLASDARPGWREADCRLVLAHCPVSFDAVQRATALPLHTFSGHTHGGQVAPFGRALYLPPGSGRYTKGWYAGASPAQQLYVSRGLGNSGIPLRVGAPPELALLTV